MAGKLSKSTNHSNYSESITPKSLGSYQKKLESYQKKENWMIYGMKETKNQENNYKIGQK